MYIEGDFLDENGREWPEPIVVEWTPKNRYIPAAPSTLGRIQKGVDEILSDLAGMDLSATTVEFRGLLTDLKPVVKNLDETTAELPQAVRDIKRWATWTGSQTRSPRSWTMR